MTAQTSKGTSKAKGTNAAAKAKVETKTAKTAVLAEAKPKATPQLTDAQREAADLKAKLATATAKAKDEARVAREAKLAAHNEAVAARKVALEAKKTATAAAKEAKKTLVPVLVTQLDEHGNPEQVDTNIFCCEITCAVPGCEEHRWVTRSGLLEATMCKPHARKERRKRRLARVKDAGRNAKAIVEDAIKQGLFPAAFLKKHGLA